MNFSGVALGDSWISPIDFVNSWADYLLATSEIDNNGWQKINLIAATTSDAVKNGQWENATNLWGVTEEIVTDASDGVNWYNILARGPNPYKTVDKSNALKSAMVKLLAPYQDDPLSVFMNGPIRQKLGIIPKDVSWGKQASMVFSFMSTAFMQPIIDGVDFLLDQGIPVAVYSGNLDLICCTPGQTIWMNKLKWKHYPDFEKAERTPISSSTTTLAFVKTYRNLQSWNILSSGHMVPLDQPLAAKMMFDAIIKG